MSRCRFFSVGETKHYYQIPRKLQRDTLDMCVKMGYSAFVKTFAGLLRVARAESIPHSCNVLHELYRCVVSQRGRQTLLDSLLLRLAMRWLNE